MLRSQPGLRSVGRIFFIEQGAVVRVWLIVTSTPKSAAVFYVKVARRSSLSARACSEVRCSVQLRYGRVSPEVLTIEVLAQVAFCALAHAKRATLASTSLDGLAHEQNSQRALRRKATNGT